MTSDDVLRTARGQHLGVGWLPVSRGVRRRATGDPFHTTLAAFREILPDGACFTHLTAARLRDWWLPPLPEDMPVFVALPPGSHRVRRPGLVAIRRSRPIEADVVEGLAVESASSVLASCARDLGVLDLVCLLDAALAAHDLALGDMIDLASLRCRGVRVLRQACLLADPRAESIYEVLLRVLHVVCGIDVVPQDEAFDEAGGFLARGDLRIVGTRVFHEYDGADHLERRRQRKDRKRDRRLGHSEWVRRGYTKEDVLFQAVSILKDADAAVGRPHDPARIRQWHELLRRSTFTAAGMTLLRQRLGLAPSGHEEAS